MSLGDSDACPRPHLFGFLRATPHAQDGDSDADPTDAAQSFTSSIVHTSVLCVAGRQKDSAEPTARSPSPAHLRL